MRDVKKFSKLHLSKAIYFVNIYCIYPSDFPSPSVLECINKCIAYSSLLQMIILYMYSIQEVQYSTV